ncbi:MAG: SDR family NAD(P)-dependent oxidoreductase [Nannocystaceae bacterium]|nr:SDR family NAD(P)-dependent oxidoreductase [Nannocystaceae bacterium]
MPSPATKHFPEFKASLPSMRDKTVVITGTTSGTGRVAAHTVADLGAKVLLLNRPSKRAEASLAALTAAFPSAQIHAVDCDLQSFASVEKAAAQVAELCPEGVHVLCNNAGVMALEDQATGDGYDVQMQTNHLSHFLLTRELWPLLVRAADSSGEARVANHSSSARMAPGKKLKASYLEKNGGNLGGNGSGLVFNGARWVRYNQSKLANAAFTAALHHRIQASGSKVKALVAHPGLARTELQETSVKKGGMGRMFTNVFMRISQSAEDGAMGIISCMCLPDATSGQFYGPGPGMMAVKGPAIAFALEGFYDNEETRELLWERSSAAIGRDFEI